MSKSSELKKKDLKQRKRELAKKEAAKKNAPPPPPPRPRNLREAVKVKPVRNVKASDILDFKSENDLKPKQLDALKRPPDPATAIPQQMLDEASPEVKAHMAAATSVDKLMSEHPKVRRIVGSMVATRRVYAVLYRELQDLLEGAEDVDPMAEDFMVQAAMHESAKAFNEHELMRGAMETLLPLIAEIVDKHIDRDAKERNEAEDAADKARRARRVPIGFKYSATQEIDGLERDKPLMLIGWAPALGWLADQIVNNVLAERDSDVYSVVRFQTAAPKKGDQNKNLIRLPKNLWKGCANGKGEMARLAGEHIGGKLANGHPDLLLIDSIADTYTKSYVGRPDGAVAGDANKVLSWWSKGLGCALIGLLPQDTLELPDIRSGEYEQLRTFTHLRPVTAEKIEDNKYRIKVGEFAASFEVSCDVVEAYARSSIILPGQ